MRRILGTLLMAVVLPVAAQGMTEAEVRKVDKDAGKLTLKHGAIPNLEMPPMTMVFRVNEPGMLDAVKAGDKVSFQADKINGQYVVTRIEPAK
jgi:Cu/Ag efflux protein CusF